ncbi:hypothetical protein [Streptomyces cyslabdanicus]|uniref:hypothetical protein n=1 Tax=Streptomyces cyslabdanicus TaxID=1470456 RepID=UPI004043FD79
MYGHGAQPPTRTSGTVIFLRVLFAATGILTCGLLACLPLFRVAMLRGKARDWVLASVSLPLSIVCFAVVGELPEDDHRSDIALCLLLLLAVYSTVYFLVVDIAHHRTAPPVGPMPSQATTYAPPVCPTPTPPQPGYGYPPAQPYAVTQSTPVPPAPYTPVPPPPQPQHPAPARIDQVRAELDELSDYLRKHEDGR